MKIKLLVFCLLSVQAWALPAQMTCYSKDVLNSINQHGTIAFTFVPFTATWTDNGGQTKILFDDKTICGRDISQSALKPACRFQDDGASRFVFECDTAGANGSANWYANGLVDVNSASKEGDFNCHTRFGPRGSLRFSLSSCQ